MLWNRNKLFCELSPTCYRISRQAWIWRRRLKDMTGRTRFAKVRQTEPLPNLITAHSSGLIKRGPGIDPELQQNKAVNIRLACAQIDGLVLQPGESFSFWRSVGKTSRRKGYRDGRVIEHGTLVPGTGGGLCNLGNTIHLLALHSPLTVTEVHFHSDALAPDAGKRVPFSAGTSVCYNYIDLRLKNETDQPLQLRLWCEDDRLCGEIRSRDPVPRRWELEEEDHHFRREGEKYYRVSKIYRCTYDNQTGALLDRTLVRDNHSEVMFDPALIPKDQLRQDE